MAVKQPIVGLNRHRVLTFAAEEYGQNDVGGNILQLKAADALLIGDAVVVVAGGEVDTTNAEADGVNFAGLVVGGRRTDMKALLERHHVGLPAADADQTVLVLTSGIGFGVADDTITDAARVGLGGTAGQVDDASDETTVAVALEAGTAGNPIKLLLNGIIHVPAAN